MARGFTVAERKPFLLRIDRDVLQAMQRWADDDLRSLNGQIEFVLRSSLKRAGRTRLAASGESARRTSAHDGPEAPEHSSKPDSTDHDPGPEPADS